MNKRYSNSYPSDRFNVKKVQRDFDDPKLEGIVVKTRVIDYDQLNFKHVNMLVPAKSARLYSHSTQKPIINSPFTVNSKAIKRFSSVLGIRVRKHSYFTVIEIPRIKFLDYGIDISCGVLSWIAFNPPLAVASICIGLLYKIKGLFNRVKISDEMAYFYLFLICVNVDSYHITEKSRLRKFFNNDYKTIMKQYFSHIKLNNDFDFVFDGLMTAGLIVFFNGFYEVKKHIRIV